jgi:ferrous iron transport protein A
MKQIAPLLMLLTGTATAPAEISLIQEAVSDAAAVSLPQNTTLDDLPPGCPARVTSVNGAGPLSRRLMEMGIVPGVGVQVVKAAPFGDPIEVRVRGYSLAMRRSEAATIEVSL